MRLTFAEERFLPRLTKPLVPVISPYARALPGSPWSPLSPLAPRGPLGNWPDRKSLRSRLRSLTFADVTELLPRSRPLTEPFLMSLPVMVSAAYEVPVRARTSASVAVTFA